MNDIENKMFLAAKRAELSRYILSGTDISLWELPQWIKIVDARDREIRRLKTALHQKDSEERY